MPIDRNFRTTWSIINSHEGHPVWSKNDEKGGMIHGEVVGLHVESCIGCMKCITTCPVDVFVAWISEDGVDVVDPILDAECILCLACELVCPTEAIHIDRQPGSQDTLDSLLRGA
ncbi:MAG: 4Fe-4S dicluster domain-containing protein [Candidatus Thorarchaeota archaeon]